MKNKLSVCGIALAVCFAAYADFVPIGNPGNAADTTGYGAVGYTYGIDQFEMTLGDFQAAVTSDSRISSSFSGNATNKPVVDVTWYEAAKYCNWLTTGDAYSGVYAFDETGTFVSQKSRAELQAAGGVYYAIATADEWYKAAYFKPDGSGYALYANGSNSIPPATDNTWNYDSYLSGPWPVGFGSQEQNGTYDMMGNVWERVEDSSGLRFGGQRTSSTNYLTSTGLSPLALGLTTENTSSGFRIVKLDFPVIIAAKDSSRYSEISYTNNAADTTGYGEVGYEYSIGKFEVSLNDFQVANNSDSRISSDFSGNADDKPVVNVDWYEAAKYCNWLTTGDAYSGVYQFDSEGTLTNVLTRAEILADVGTTWYAIATLDEWYKAAYFMSDGSGYSQYANGTNSIPEPATSTWNYDKKYSGPWAVGTGAEEQNGTFDMMGNVWERVEDSAGYRMGGQYASSASYLDAGAPLSLGQTTQNDSTGFRIVRFAAKGYDGFAGQYGVGGPLDDDDDDGMLNVYEYGLGGDPTDPQNLGTLPTYSFSANGASNLVQCIYPRLATENPGIIYRVEARRSLTEGDWSAAGFSINSVGAENNGFEAVTEQLNTTDDTQFIRLIIEQSP